MIKNAKIILELFVLIQTKYALKKFKTVSSSPHLDFGDYLRYKVKLGIVHRSAHNATISRNTYVSPKNFEESSFDYDENLTLREVEGGGGEGDDRKRDLLASSSIFSFPSYHPS